MGPFSLVCVSLFGAYVMTATYASILWIRDRQSRLPLIVALHAATAAVVSFTVLLISRSTTLPAMQGAVSLRLVAVLAMTMCLTWLLATVSDRPPRAWVGALSGLTVLVLFGSYGHGTLAPDITGIDGIRAFGEPVWAPKRDSPYRAALLLMPILFSQVFALDSARRLYRRDPFAATLVAGVAAVSLAVMPFLWVVQPGRIAAQFVTLALQLGFVLLGLVLIAREHQSRARTSVEAQRLYRAMFEQTYQYIAMLDLDGRVLDANGTSLAAIGATVEDVRGQFFIDTPWWARSRDRLRVAEAIKAAAAGEPRRFEAAATVPWGEVLVDCTIRPLRDETGAVVRLIPEARDITEERAAQEAREKADAQLQQSQKLEAVGQLAGGIAHDFNNLLTVIHGFASLLASTPEARTRSMELEQIQGASERAISLTRQLLTFSRHGVADEQVIDLNALLHRVEPLLRRQLGADVVLTVTAGQGVPRVKVDPVQFERVLINLVANARDAMPHGGRLSVTTGSLSTATAPARLRDMEGAAQLTVSDTGEGMSPAVVARLFEPFFTTKATGKGTGLGLAVVDRVVRQAGGLVDVVSAPGAGTTFTIALPAATSEVAPAVGPVGVGGSTSAFTVLVVDDEPPVRQLAVTILAQQGYRVIQAGSAEEALAVAAGHDRPIDLLLADVVMPGGSATSIADGLVVRQGGVRVLYMSGYPADEMVRRGVATGVSNFIQKPFTPDGLAQRVRNLLHAPVPDAV